MPSASNERTTARLPEEEFRRALELLPLVSLDLCLTDPAGRLLLGLRLNAPARGTWFTPGGRVHKDEPLLQALRRIGRDELGASEDQLGGWPTRARLMGAWDHFYEDSAFDPNAATRYVNLPHWLDLSHEDVASLRLPVGDQHSAWCWMELGEAARHPLVHEHVRPYADWIARALSASR